MLVTSLVGKYIHEYSDCNEIVAAYIDRGELMLVAKNPDGRLYQCIYNGIKIVDSPKQEESQE